METPTPWPSATELAALPEAEQLTARIHIMCELNDPDNERVGQYHRWDDEVEMASHAGSLGIVYNLDSGRYALVEDTDEGDEWVIDH